MTSAEMLTRSRVFLDEATETFYDTDNIYESLTQAQIELAQVIGNHWFRNLREDNKPIPVAVRPLISDVSGVLAGGKISVTDFLVPIYLESGSDPIGIHTYLEDDSLGRRLRSSPILDEGLYYYYKLGGLYVINPLDTSIRTNFIHKPTTISASVEPEIDLVAHDAVVERGLSILLADSEAELAQTHLAIYQGLLKGLLV